MKPGTYYRKLSDGRYEYGVIRQTWQCVGAAPLWGVYGSGTVPGWCGMLSSHQLTDEWYEPRGVVYTAAWANYNREQL